MAPSYLADDRILASSGKFSRRLRSADVDTCIVPRIRTRFGDRSFPAAGPRIWNSYTSGTATARHWAWRIPSITNTAAAAAAAATDTTTTTTTIVRNSYRDAPLSMMWRCYIA